MAFSSYSSFVCILVFNELSCSSVTKLQAVQRKYKDLLFKPIKLKIFFTFCLDEWDSYPFYLMSVNVNMHAVESVKMDSSELEKVCFIF